MWLINKNQNTQSTTYVTKANRFPRPCAFRISDVLGLTSFSYFWRDRFDYKIFAWKFNDKYLNSCLQLMPYSKKKNLHAALYLIRGSVNEILSRNWIEVNGSRTCPNKLSNSALLLLIFPFTQRMTASNTYWKWNSIILDSEWGGHMYWCNELVLKLRVFFIWYNMSRFVRV